MSGVAALKSIVRPGAPVRAQALAERLEEIRAAGLVHRASEHVGGDVEQVLPVASALRALLPGGSLRRGGTLSIATASASTATDSASADTTGAGSTSLLLGLLAEASATGSWCAVVGLPTLGLVAAAEAGVAVERSALVPHPGPDWAGVVAALLDGVDIVVAATPGPVSPQIASRLAARARQRGAVLMAMGQWPGADLTLEVVASTWHGLGQGRGRLRRHEIEVRAHGRGAASRPRRARLWLPAFPISSSTSSPSTPLLALATSPRDEARDTTRDTTRSAAGRYEREVA